MIRTTSFEEVSIAVATVAQVATMGRVAGNLIVAVTGAAGGLAGAAAAAGGCSRCLYTVAKLGSY